MPTYDFLPEHVDWTNPADPLIAFISDPANRADNPFIDSVARSYVSYGSLTDAQTVTVIRIMNGERTAPAMAAETQGISNGVYEVTYDTDTYVFAIYTVMRGSLEGKRIIKRLTDADTSPSVQGGFAFLSNTGSVQMWRRFAQDVNLPYVQAAKAMVNALRMSGSRHGDNSYPEVGVSISARILCNYCNAPHSGETSLLGRAAPFCARHESLQTSTVSEAMTDRVDFARGEFLINHPEDAPYVFNVAVGSNRAETYVDDDGIVRSRAVPPPAVSRPRRRREPVTRPRRRREPVTTEPNRSALGTRIDGEVWIQ